MGQDGQETALGRDYDGMAQSDALQAGGSMDAERSCGFMNVTPDTIKKHAGGRPSRWSIATAKKICGFVRRGIPLRYAGPLAGVPWSTCKEWAGEHPEFPPMLEEAHSAFVQDHVGNIERHSRTSEKGSQWLLERRAKEEFSAPYTQNNASQPSLNVLALGGDALAKLMQGWGGMIAGQTAGQSQPIPIPVESQQIPDIQPTPTLLPEHITESNEPPKIKLDIPSEKIEAPKIEEVKPKRGRGRPRKYPKPDGVATPPPHATPNL